MEEKNRNELFKRNESRIQEEIIEKELTIKNKNNEKKWEIEII